MERRFSVKISVKNIGKLKNATVEINGITVIAGENDTGKSTVGKALFGVFNGFFDIKQQISKERAKNLAEIIVDIVASFEDNLQIPMDYYEESIFEYLLENEDILDGIIDAAASNHDVLINMLNEVILACNDEFDFDEAANLAFETIPESLFESLKGGFKVSDDAILSELLRLRILDEFNGQANNIYTDTPGEITLTIKNKPLCIKIQENRVIALNDKLNLKTEAIYIDDPFLIDAVIKNMAAGFIKPFYNHRSHLMRKLSAAGEPSNVVNDIIVTEKFGEFFKKTGDDFSKYVMPRRSRLGNRGNKNETLDIRNLSTGMKTFLIIKTLLTSGAIKSNGTLILDEPEIHLHPEWQLLFAELIVLIQKEFGVHILLNTHSPYFLRAIQVYAANHKIADKCKYYLSELGEDGAYINDVSDDIEKIYKKLASPFQRLDDERWLDD